VLTPLFEGGFSTHSYGFREGRVAADLKVLDFGRFGNVFLYMRSSSGKMFTKYSSFCFEFPSFSSVISGRVLYQWGDENRSIKILSGSS
jgi:hypothetical protein